MVGIDPTIGCHARLLPRDKLQCVTQREQTRGQHVCMVGDGINDAVALAGT